MLPFGGRAWSGGAGSWRGRNQGNSIDYHDHRAYAPGDDPRHLDWAAYARTNNYIMKLFSEEVSPRLDVALDCSPSMAVTRQKEERCLDLLTLVISLAEKANVSTKLYAFLSSGQIKPLEVAAARRLENLPTFEKKKPVSAAAAAKAFPLAEIPWRGSSLRLLICDLLSPHSPEAELTAVLGERARVIILAPFVTGEANPTWRGNLEMLDCESTEIRRQRVDPWLLDKYRAAYRRHFELWQETARKRSVRLAQVPCELPLTEAVQKFVLPCGALEVRS